MSWWMAQAQEAAEAADTLSKANEVQLLAIAVVAIACLFGLFIRYHLREKLRWELAHQSVVDRWGEAKVAWEAERTAAAQRERGLTADFAKALQERDDRHSQEKEAALREMLALALRLERVITRAARQNGAAEDDDP